MNKKDARLQNKIGKWKAFLNVCRLNDEDRLSKAALHVKRGVQSPPPDSANEVEHAQATKETNKRPTDKHVTQKGEVADDYVAELKAVMHRRVKQKMMQPKVYLTDIGLKAKFDWTRCPSGLKPLHIVDIQHLLLKTLDEEISSLPPRWCVVLRSRKISHVVMVFAEGVTAADLRKNANAMKTLQALSPLAVEIKPIKRTGCSSTIQAFLSVDSVSKSQKAKRAVDLRPPPGSAAKRMKTSEHSKMPKKDSAGRSEISDRNSAGNSEISDRNSACNTEISDRNSASDKFPRTSLLLNPEQMILESYPLDQFPSYGYKFTKEHYTVVTADSPLFGIDCEMCMTVAQCQELTRVTVVNEQLQCIYDTLVKPKHDITNYLTKFSGITEKMLRHVKTRLEDVQEQISKLLPSDAILCGQSLNADLNALKLFHPYVIDTSVIYNLHHGHRQKSSLKNLVKYYLKEDIQCGNDGHDSVEDSSAALRLVKLKLANSLDFGDCKGDTSRTAFACCSSNTTLTASETIISFRIGYHLKKNVCLSTSDFVERLQLPGYGSLQRSQVVQKATEMVSDKALVVAHLEFTIDKESSSEKQEEVLTELDKYVEAIYNSCADNALFILLATGPCASKEDVCLENGVCMAKLKVSIT